MEIILLHPEIPQNAGNIARTCAVTKTSLTLVRPLGFNVGSRPFKRAGLDYLDNLSYNVVDELELKAPYYFFSTKGKKLYTEIAFERDAQLIFGSETAGFPAEIHENYGSHIFTIPMRPQARSLNLSNAVAIVLYEALRQQEFRELL